MTRITRHPSHGGGDSAGAKLAATLLSVAVAGMSDPARFRRGKSYVLDNAVTELEVLPGMLRVEVLGSRPDPYLATISVDPRPRPADLVGDRVERHHAAQLCPEPEEMVCSCTCPDFDDPCKHAIAGLLTFAQEVAARPQLLVEWRCGAGLETPRPVAGARAATGRHLRLVGQEPPPDVARYSTREWAEFEGHHLEAPDVAALLGEWGPVRSGAAMVGGVDLGAIVRTAQERAAAAER
jgi:SWIM zinc finger